MIAARINRWIQGLVGFHPCVQTPLPEKKPLVFGIPLCWGIDPRWATLPIINLPGDAVRVKRRLRVNEAATVIVKTPRGVQMGRLRPTEDTFAAATSLTALWNAANVTYP